jgi:hypothetical protein
MTSTIKVWFRLVDSIGSSYKGTTTDKVSLSTDADVIDFRDAVKAKYSDSVLLGIAASQLLIYKNRATFEETRDLQHKEEPLKSSLSVVHLGETEEHALIVVVPMSGYPQPIQAEQQGAPCRIPFYNDLSKATELDGMLLFDQTVPSSTLNRLYIRESYKTIASSIKPGINKAIITGTPGIGKSLFLIYLLWKLVKAGKRVLLIYHPCTIYYDGQGHVFELNATPSVTNHDFWNADLWCLFDAKDKEAVHLSALPYEMCTFILSMSPRREMVNDFKKPPVPQEFYMPTWSEAELEAIVPFFPNVTEWRDRFENLGGIPRHVMEVTIRPPAQMLEAACTACSLDDCIKVIGMNSTITEKSKVVHLLVHITSTAPYTDSSVRFAS